MSAARSFYFSYIYIYSHPIPKGFLFSKIGRDDESKTQTRPSSIPLTDAARESRSHEKPTCTWQGTHFHEDVIVQMGRSDAGVSSGGHVGSQLNKCPLEIRATPRANLPPSLSLSLPSLNRRRGIGGAHVSSSMRNSNRGWSAADVYGLRSTYLPSFDEVCMYMCCLLICVARARIAATIFRHTRIIARVRLEFLINRSVSIEFRIYDGSFRILPEVCNKIGQLAFLIYGEKT